MNLRIPGPTPLPPQVVAALQRPMINHRSPVFADLQNRIVDRLRDIFETTNDILILPGSGTGGLESALVNSLSPGDHVLACIAGQFGKRFAEIATAFGADVHSLDFAPGSAIDPGKVAESLRAAPNTRAVLVTHNETSTGVLHPLQAIAQAVHQNSNALVVVDAVSSLGATRVAADEWGLDVVVTGSQKALMSPPGMALISISQHAWHTYEHATTPRFYWDWMRWKKWAAKGQTPWTPAVSVYFALDAALDIIHQEGLANVYARHSRLADWTRSRALQLGMSLFADPRHASPSVTAVRPPEGLDANALVRRMRQEHDVEVAGGQGELSGKIIRIGHLGYVHDADMQDTIYALERTLIAQPVSV